MRKAIGFVIVLWVITKLMSSSFSAFESALIASLNTVETAATVSQVQLQKQLEQ